MFEIQSHIDMPCVISSNKKFLLIASGDYNLIIYSLYDE